MNRVALMVIVGVVLGGLVAAVAFPGYPRAWTPVGFAVACVVYVIGKEAMTAIDARRHRRDDRDE